MTCHVVTSVVGQGDPHLKLLLWTYVIPGASATCSPRILIYGSGLGDRLGEGVIRLTSLSAPSESKILAASATAPTATVNARTPPMTRAGGCRTTSHLP